MNTTIIFRNWKTNQEGEIHLVSAFLLIWGHKIENSRRSRQLQFTWQKIRESRGTWTRPYTKKACANKFPSGFQLSDIECMHEAGYKTKLERTRINNSTGSKKARIHTVPINHSGVWGNLIFMGNGRLLRENCFNSCRKSLSLG